MKRTLLVAVLALATAGGAAPSGQGRQFHFNGRVWKVRLPLSERAFAAARVRLMRKLRTRDWVLVARNRAIRLSSFP
jgi:hypothetical protein